MCGAKCVFCILRHSNNSKHWTGLLNDKYSKCHMHSHRTAKYAACHNKFTTVLSTMYAKAKRTHAYTAKQLKASQHGSLICAVCLVYYHSLLKVQNDHRFCCLKCCWIASSQVFDACSSDVRSNSIMQYLLHWTPATGHRLTPWIADWGAETAPVVFLMKTSRHFRVLVFFLVCCELFWSASSAKHTDNR